jgi:hypothetical protein
MKDTTPRLSISAQFTIKNVPGPGLKSVSWNFGKDQYVPMSKLMWDVCRTIIENFGTVVTPEEVTKEFELFQKWIASLSVGTTLPDDGKDHMRL